MISKRYRITGDRRKEERTEMGGEEREKRWRDKLSE
jgi:hypothetical protein